MAFTTKLLASGLLPAAVANIYLNSAGTKGAIIKNIVVVNKDSIIHRFNLYVLPNAGTRRYITPVNLELDPGARFSTEDENFTIAQNDSIQADATSSTMLDFSVHGVEET